MSYIPMLLLVAAATTDSFVIGFNYGVKAVRISFHANMFIAVLCYAGTLISMLAGKALTGLIYDGFTGLISGAVLTFLGIYMLVGALDNRKSKKERFSENPDEVDTDSSKIIEPRESLMIGILLSLNNMGLGVGAGLAGYSLWLTPPACAIFSFLFICGGRLLGGYIENPWLSQILEVLSAVLIIMLGGCSLVQCLLL